MDFGNLALQAERQRGVLRVAAMFVGVICLYPSAQAAAAQGVACARIDAVLARISAQTDADTRTDLAEAMTHLVQQQPQCGKDPDRLDRIGVLLADTDDTMRAWAADSLGFIGPSAMRTVPALEKAMRLSDSLLDADPSPVLPTTYSGQAIRWALRRITHKPIPEYNETRRPNPPSGPR